MPPKAKQSQKSQRASADRQPSPAKPDKISRLALKAGPAVADAVAQTAVGLPSQSTQIAPAGNPSGDAEGPFQDLANGNPAEAVAQRIKTAKRDVTGLLIGGDVNCTEDQFLWLSYRMGVSSDKEATELSGLDPLEVLKWLADPEFSGLCQVCVADKREAFRVLGGQLLPKALRVINDMLDSEAPRTQDKGLNYLLRTQALLIDKVQQTDANAITQLVNSLREHRPVEIIQGEFKEVV